jgi:uncharacterized membrane protein YkoI
MKYRTIGLSLAALSLLAASPAIVAAKTSGNVEVPASEATVSVDKARTIALQVRPGKITDEELEKEGGGSGLRYSFDIKDNATTYEVGVDAKTGEVLENMQEGNNPD